LGEKLCSPLPTVVSKPC
jgi:hypothetical protein